jgi:hypothetical protein
VPDEPLQLFTVTWSWGPEVVRSVEVEAASVEDAREKAYGALDCTVRPKDSPAAEAG